MSIVIPIFLFICHKDSCYLFRSSTIMMHRTQRLVQKTGCFIRPVML